MFSQKENLDQILIQNVYSNGVIIIPEEEYKSGLSSFMSSQGNLRANASDLSDQSKVDKSGNFMTKSILEPEDPEKKFQINFPNLSHIQIQNQGKNEDVQQVNSSPGKRTDERKVQSSSVNQRKQKVKSKKRNTLNPDKLSQELIPKKKKSLNSGNNININININKKQELNKLANLGRGRDSQAQKKPKSNVIEQKKSLMAIYLERNSQKLREI